MKLICGIKHGVIDVNDCSLRLLEWERFLAEERLIGCLRLFLLEVGLFEVLLALQDLLLQFDELVEKIVNLSRGLSGSGLGLVDIGRFCFGRLLGLLQGFSQTRCNLLAIFFTFGLGQEFFEDGNPVIPLLHFGLGGFCVRWRLARRRAWGIIWLAYSAACTIPLALFPVGIILPIGKFRAYGIRPLFRFFVWLFPRYGLPLSGHVV